MTRWRRDSSFRVIWRAWIIAEQLQGGGSETGNSPADISSTASHPPFLRRAAGWIRHHKVRTILILICALIAAELCTIPWFDVARLRTENPLWTALMRQRAAEAAGAGRPYRVTQKWVSLSRIPKQVVDAIVVAEDGTFYAHGGFDWFEVRESIEKDIQEGRAVRGASTITQQVAKNLFLSTSKDPVRKAKEFLITLLLERELSKDRILEIYLNIAEWGPGVFGIEAASETYFGTRADNLTLDQGARLAAVIPSPLRHRPDSDARYVLRRKGIVLGRMEARNMVAVPDTPPVRAAGDSASRRRDTAAAPSADSGAVDDTTEIDEGGANGL